MARLTKVMLIYSVGALLGPFLRLVTWPPFSRSRESFIYDLVLLLWPTQLFAVNENYMGRTGAILSAISMNVLLFVFVGVIMMAAARKKSYLMVAGSAVIIAIVTFALWGAGFDYSYLNGYALLFAVTFYSLLLFTTTII